MTCSSSRLLAALSATLSMLAGMQTLRADKPADVLTMPADLNLPPISQGEPSPGKRVLLSLPDYAGTAVKHALFLPTDWEKDKTYPLIVEYAGNGRTVAEGNSCMGYGISGGKGFLWLCLPYVSTDHKRDMDWWWGDVDATVAYAKQAVPAICKQWGGDSGAVILVGHSRGAIACNYIGLHDDEIAKLWRAMVPCSHYDNGVYPWGMSKEEQVACERRLHRLGGIPQFICGEYHLPAGHSDKKLLDLVREKKLDGFEKARTELNLVPMLSHEKIDSFIAANLPRGNCTLVNLPFVNHTAEWVLRDVPERKMLRDWVRKVLDNPPGQVAASGAASRPRLPDPAFAQITDDPNLPRVLILGDSVSIGYTLALRKELASKANVHRPAANCGSTKIGLRDLDKWLGDKKWDVIHFNWGLHDLGYRFTENDNRNAKGEYARPDNGGHQNVPPAEYEKNLRELVGRLKKTGAKLIFATTTPVPADLHSYVKGAEAPYNEAARKVMKEEGVIIDDLWTFSMPQLDKLQIEGNPHFTSKGSAVLAKEIARIIEAALPAKIHSDTTK